LFRVNDGGEEFSVYGLASRETIIFCAEVSTCRCDWQLLEVDTAYPRSLVIARTVPPPLGAPNLGKRLACSHLAVGRRGRSVLGDAQRLDLANHDCKHAIRKYE
jgi:hypothetical protein